MSKTTRRGAAMMALCILASIVLTMFASVPAKAVDNPVADGWYMIISGNSPFRALDIAGWDMDDGGNLITWYKTNTPNQRFYVKYLYNGYYSIMAKHSGRYLHKRGSDDIVHQWNGEDNTNAQWAFEPVGNGYYYLRNRTNGKYLDNYGGGTTDDNEVGLWDQNWSDNQKWLFVSTSDTSDERQSLANGWYMIESGNSSERVLDINNWNMENGGNLETYNKNGTTNQIFYLEYKNNGYYTIQAYHSRLFLHKQNAGTFDNVVQWGGNEDDQTMWALQPAGDRYYYIRSKCGNYMDNSGGSTTPGNNVITYNYNGSNAQKWRFIPVDVGAGKTYYVSTRGSNVNVRKSASDSSKVIGSVANGGKVEVSNINYSSSYAQVKYNGQTGYMHSEYLLPRKPEKVFNQNNYGQYYYGYASNADERNGKHATIASGGCGIVSITNAAYYLNGRTIEPTDLAKFAINNGYRPNGGTKEGLVRAFCDARGGEYGIKWIANIKNENGSADTIRKAKSYLQNGNVAVVHVDGHFIAVVDYDARTDKYLILDSYPAGSRNTSGTGYWWAKASDFTGRLLVQSGYEGKNIQIFGKA